MRVDVEILLVSPANTARQGVTDQWYAQFVVGDGQIYGGLGATAWEAIAWSVDGYMRRINGQLFGGAKPSTFFGGSDGSAAQSMQEVRSVDPVGKKSRDGKDDATRRREPGRRRAATGKVRGRRDRDGGASG